MSVIVSYKNGLRIHEVTGCEEPACRCRHLPRVKGDPTFGHCPLEPSEISVGFARNNPWHTEVFVRCEHSGTAVLRELLRRAGIRVRDVLISTTGDLAWHPRDRKPY